MNTQAKPRIAVLYGKGTNCHDETLWAIHCAGGYGEIVLLNDLFSETVSLLDFQAMIIPGGFSWGDHIAAGRVQAIHMIHALCDQLWELLERKRPIMGICNGFQVLTETGLLSKKNIGKPDVVLRQNDSARFEHRMVQLLFEKTDSLWTHGLAGRVLVMPVAHAEGRFQPPVTDGSSIITACSYVDYNGATNPGYPHNPNGSCNDIAGIVDSTGLVYGMMPHPERAIEKWHPSQDGLLLFQNLVSYLKQS